MKADRECVTRLLKTARGQIEGVLRMSEEDQYCIDLSTQIMAAQAILRKANGEILRAHLESCVRGAAMCGDEREKDQKIEELVEVIGKLTK